MPFLILWICAPTLPTLVPMDEGGATPQSVTIASPSRPPYLKVSYTCKPYSFSPFILRLLDYFYQKSIV